jgi:hypothetical protein
MPRLCLRGEELHTFADMMRIRRENRISRLPPASPVVADRTGLQPSANPPSTPTANLLERRKLRLSALALDTEESLRVKQNPGRGQLHPMLPTYRTSPQPPPPFAGQQWQKGAPQKATNFGYSSSLPVPATEPLRMQLARAAYATHGEVQSSPSPMLTSPMMRAGYVMNPARNFHPSQQSAIYPQAHTLPVDPSLTQWEGIVPEDIAYLNSNNAGHRDQRRDSPGIQSPARLREPPRT